MALIPAILTEIGGRNAVLEPRLDLIGAAHVTALPPRKLKRRDLTHEIGGGEDGHGPARRIRTPWGSSDR